MLWICCARFAAARVDCPGYIRTGGVASRRARECLPHAFLKPRYNNGQLVPFRALCNADKPPAHPTHEQWDLGRVLMNVGAVSSLTGFMMTDVLYLRALSVFGSTCGVIYNSTRQPPQWNGVLWGCAFIGLNMTMIFKLLRERQEMMFTVDEMELYKTHFEPHSVSPTQFFRLMKLAKWRTLNQQDHIVSAGHHLDRVIYIHRGGAEAWSVSTSTAGSPPAMSHLLYTYESGSSDESRRGSHCVIGGTALVKPSVKEKPYPNNIVAIHQPTVVVEWNFQELQSIMATEKSVEVAMLRMLYVDLLASLKKEKSWAAKLHRHASLERDSETDQIDDFFITLEAYRHLLYQVVADGAVTPAEKRRCREYREQNGISKRQHAALLRGLGWTVQEWDDGDRFEKTEGVVHNDTSTLWLNQHRLETVQPNHQPSHMATAPLDPHGSHGTRRAPDLAKAAAVASHNGRSAHLEPTAGAVAGTQPKHMVESADSQ